MEDLSSIVGVTARKLRSFLPETIEEAEELAALIERAVQSETGGGIDNLTVVIDHEGVLLKGRCDSYYCKQLAQHAAMNLFSGEERLVNGIEVR